MPRIQTSLIDVKTSEKSTEEVLNKDRIIRTATKKKQKHVNDLQRNVLTTLIHHLCSRKDDARGKLALLFCSLQISDICNHIFSNTGINQTAMCVLCMGVVIWICVVRLSQIPHTLFYQGLL